MKRFLALGFIARMVPQMNVFIVGFPLKIGIGFLGIVITLNLFTQMYPDLFSDMHSHLLHLLRTVGK
ncbi:MAG: flagellar biosynthetic protein FliR [Armatimonadetes bacterium]|nr:flagellar biosynthetic protein FliR [Armatimonadota bacterium]